MTPAGREKQRLSWRQVLFFFFVGLQGLSSTPLALLILLIGSGLAQPGRSAGAEEGAPHPRCWI